MKASHVPLIVLIATVLAARAGDAPLVVVENLGGVSALPYYRALNLQPTRMNPALKMPAVSAPPSPAARYSEEDLLPVQSATLTPGTVPPRVLAAPGFMPLFMIGDDTRSRAWLQRRLPELRSMHAVGIVVRVDSQASLNALRRLAPGLTLVPAAGDDLAQRIGVRHYPVLITATGIEQ